MASHALYRIHDLMRVKHDDWWREVYRHRCELGHLIDARLNAWASNQKAG